MATLIDNRSRQGMPSELGLFSVPPTQIAVNRSFESKILPETVATSDGPYNFNIPGDANYLDLNRTYVRMMFRLTQHNGAPITAGDAGANGKVGVINMLGLTFFKQMKLFFNSTLVYDSEATFAYKNYLEYELNYGTDAKETYLRSMLYTKENAALANTENGYDKRVAMFASTPPVAPGDNPISKYVDTFVPLSCPIFNQSRYLINHMDVRIELYRNDDAFCIMNFNNPVVKIDVAKMELYVRKIELLKSVDLGLNSALLKKDSPAKYPIRRTQVLTRQIQGGLRSFEERVLFAGQIPRRLVIGLVSPTAFYGTYGEDPFVFAPFNLSKIHVTAANRNYPDMPLELNYAHNIYQRAYHMLSSGTGKAGSNEGNAITSEEFLSTHNLYVFNMTKDGNDGDHWEQIETGPTEIHLEFSADTPANGLKLLVYAEYDNTIYINHSRETRFDYSV